MPLPSECCSCAGTRLGVAPGFGRGPRAFRWSPWVWRWSALRSPWEDKSHRGARRPPSAWERGDPRKRPLRRRLFRCLNRERDVRRPSLQPVAGVELVIASEIEVTFAVRDWKEKPDLRPDSGNARFEFTEPGAGAAVGRQLVVDIADGAEVEFVGEIRRNRPIQVRVDAALVLGVRIDEVVGEPGDRGPFKSNLLVQIGVAGARVCRPMAQSHARQASWIIDADGNTG